MLKIMGKACIGAIMALLLSLAVWYFLLIKLPEDALVQGTGSPNISKEEVLSLLNFHGAQVAYIKDGKWFFDRNGEAIPLKRKP